jgi:hypothetical protein
MTVSTTVRCIDLYFLIKFHLLMTLLHFLLIRKGTYCMRRLGFKAYFSTLRNHILPDKETGSQDARQAEDRVKTVASGEAA